MTELAPTPSLLELAHTPMCPIRRAALLQSNEKKLFILHDEGHNSTIAKHLTLDLAYESDRTGITAYYRNAPMLSLGPNGEAKEDYPRSWLGRTKYDLNQSQVFIRNTCDRKGPYYGLLALGSSCPLARAVAQEHDVSVQTHSPADPTSSYPLLLVTALGAHSLLVPSPTSIPTSDILALVQLAIDSQKKLYSFPKPTLEELKAAKRALKEADAARQRLRAQQIKEGTWVPFDKTKRTQEEEPMQGMAKYSAFKYPYSPAVVKPASSANVTETTVPVSNYISNPTAEPVTPCSLDSLSEMITWLRKNEDITPDAEPRIDFSKGSILGKTTPGGGTSVDLCKQVVGPKGIKPVLDAVAENQWIDRFLLGNNIVGDEGAQVIADFIVADQARNGKIYNFYIAGNSISSTGIASIASALEQNAIVTALWLKRNPIGDLGATHISSMLAINSTLQVLDLVNTAVGDAGITALFSALSSNPNSALLHLYLGSSGLTSLSAKAAGDYLRTGKSKLRSLFMSMSRLGDSGATYLAEGLRMQDSIQRLGLSSCLIGDAGAIALTDALKGKKSLAFLDLGWRRGTLELGEEGNVISDVGALYIAEHLVLTLRELDLSENLMTFNGVSKFVDEYVERSGSLFDVKLRQRMGTGRKNAQAQKRANAICKRNKDKIAKAGYRRLEQVLHPQHVKDIYSIYRGNM